MATKENELRMPYLSSRIVYRHGMNEARYDIIDHVFRYGGEGDIAITGDWNGDGITEIGVYRNGEWYLDRNGNGVLDDGDEILKGVVGDDYLPVVGDFDGDGVDTIGYFANGTWYLDVNSDHNLKSSILNKLAINLLLETGMATARTKWRLPKKLKLQTVKTATSRMSTVIKRLVIQPNIPTETL